MNADTLAEADWFDQSPDIELPPFMVDEPNYLDGWAPPEELGDYHLDFVMGHMYAEMAVRYARAVNDPAALTFIIASMQVKALRGDRKLGATENGFFERLCRLAYSGSCN